MVNVGPLSNMRFALLFGESFLDINQVLNIWIRSNLLVAQQNGIVIMIRACIVRAATLSVDVEVATIATDQSEICESTTTRARPPILTIILKSTVQCKEQLQLRKVQLSPLCAG